MNPAPPPTSRLLETALYVADLEVAEQFYARVFGFTAMMRDERLRALDVPGRGALLLFRRGASVQASHTPFGPIPPHDGRGVLHLAFAVPADSLPRWEAHLAELGIAVESRLDWPQGATSIYFRDPDGHSVEIATPGLWPNDRN